MATAGDIATVTGEYVSLDGEQYYRIANHHLMDDFFMSLVGASDHWMFISSNGALTAGRRNADRGAFPVRARRSDLVHPSANRFDHARPHERAGSLGRRRIDLLVGTVCTHAGRG